MFIQISKSLTVGSKKKEIQIDADAFIQLLRTGKVEFDNIIIRIEE